MTEEFVEQDPENFNRNFVYPEIQPKYITRQYIQYPFLKEFKDSDFDLKSKTLIDFKTIDDEGKTINEGNWLVLFCDESEVSSKYLKMWTKLAQAIKDTKCYIGFCNLSFENRVLKAFQTLDNPIYINHPYYWARFIESPFIVVYRDSWPQGFYNGGLFFTDLVNFCTFTVANSTIDVSKEHYRRPELLEELRTRESQILKELMQEERAEKQKEDREIMKQVDPRNQVIAHAVDFD